jgi:hypothetical protein
MCSQRAICHHSRQFACANDLWCGQAATGGALNRSPRVVPRLSVSDNSQRPTISTVAFAIPNGSSGSFRASNRGRLSVKRSAAPFATECQLCHAQHLQAAPDPSGGMADQPELF